MSRSGRGADAGKRGPDVGRHIRFLTLGRGTGGGVGSNMCGSKVMCHSQEWGCMRRPRGASAPLEGAGSWSWAKEPGLEVGRPKSSVTFGCAEDRRSR